MEIRILAPGDALWSRASDYAAACPWPGGAELAKRMRANEFADWERVFLALDGESPAALMERQPDDEGRAVIGDILSINTDLDDEGLMQMAQDCLKKLRRERLEKEMDKLQKSLSTLPEEQRAAATQRAFQLAQQLTELR